MSSLHLYVYKKVRLVPVISITLVEYGVSKSAVLRDECEEADSNAYSSTVYTASLTFHLLKKVFVISNIG